jgi:hypothetical protein
MDMIVKSLKEIPMLLLSKANSSLNHYISMVLTQTLLGLLNNIVSLWNIEHDIFKTIR